MQGILAKDALCWVQNQVLYINGASMEAYMPSVSISAGEKQLISMGAYLCIFPDGIYFNTEKYSDNGYMGQENTVNAASTNIDISLCLVDGTALTVSYKQASQKTRRMASTGSTRPASSTRSSSGRRRRASGYPCRRCI